LTLRPDAQPTGDAGDDPHAAAIEAALRSMAPPGVDVGTRRIDAADVSALWPDELAAVGDSVAKRQREFATGRVLLRHLLGRDGPIAVRTDRSPDLPPGFVGSLAHDDTFVIAAVSSRATVTALGIDVEPTVPLAIDVAALIVRPDERDIDAHLAFTLKEATYKAWSGAGGRMLDHHDVRLTVDASRFSAEVIDDQVWFEGRYQRVDDRWVALVIVGR
jgi:4'-phosphopantetheinyl transferase EntD